MIIRHQKRQAGIQICLCEELDHHAARKTMNELDRLAAIYPQDAFTLNLQELTFMDSSGIAVVIHLFRTLQASGRAFTVTHASKHAMRIFRAAGLDKIINFQEGEA